MCAKKSFTSDPSKLSIRKLLNKRMISYLNPNETKTQFERSRSFIDGLQQASEVLRSYFRITSRGMAKAQWRDRSSLNSVCPSPVRSSLDLESAS